ncbi:hypothetical protein HS088_TW15G00080 [Tripterygium wilfordii]|uniref:U-box domain-containing protein n=1 Tax=Tripterygium wilfordii TaxID=458696 RepID=A0A7J7CKM2_TRIWF|nr:U-box domain-containing protein 21-like [Tripterygium wilfordii]KAF5734588.1 hypothetical protein HS088_TW15G00080 [Tripterygium wilfordii]
MGFGWRKRKTALNRQRKGDIDAELVIPNHFRCPISLDLMKDPVTLSSGITYDRESIEKWLESGNFTCPVTNQVLRSYDQIPNHTLRSMIQEWCVENRKFGAERIPTPRVPVTGIEVSEILFGVEESVKRLDRCGCLDLVKKIRTLGSESERNRRCIVQNGTGGVLAAAFDEFARDSCERNEIALKEILCCLTWMLPFDAETQVYLGSKDSLGCLVWFLRNEDSTSVKQNSIVALKELASCDQKHVEALAGIEGVVEILFKFIQRPISTTIKKSSLMLSFQLVSFNEKIRKLFSQMGLVPILLESMIDTERSICEPALGVLDRLCDCDEGREEAYKNALTIPVLVKKILGVSDLASEYSISIIWKLIKYEQRNNGDGSIVLVEALQVGAFQKVLLLLQLGCGDETKQKVAEVLKSMNPYRTTSECIETSDFKNLKRSF